MRTDRTLERMGGIQWFLSKYPGATSGDVYDEFGWATWTRTRWSLRYLEEAGRIFRTGPDHNPSWRLRSSEA